MGLKGSDTKEASQWFKQAYNTLNYYNDPLSVIKIQKIKKL
jgi:hypothetical protein